MSTLMPVYSPLTIGAVTHGVAATLFRSNAARARQEVETWLGGGEMARESLLVDSGTSALTLALLGTQGDIPRPVAIPAFACFDIATSVDGARVPFVFYDVDPETLGPDLKSLRRAAESGADRFVIVHLYGIPVELDAVRALAKEYDALVIEDAAQGIGGEWRGRPLGSHGSLGVFSFGRGKGLTGGGGGALVGNDAVGRRIVTASRRALASAGSPLREIATLGAQWALARRSTFWVPSALPFLGLGETTYRAPRPAAEISSFAAAVISDNLASAARETAIRVRNATRLLAHVDLRRFTPVRSSTAGKAGYLRLPVVECGAASPGSRGDRGLGIMPGYPLALPDLSGFGHKALVAEDTPGARRLATRLLTVPVHGALLDQDLEALGAWLAAPDLEGRNNGA